MVKDHCLNNGVVSMDNEGSNTPYCPVKPFPGNLKWVYLRCVMCCCACLLFLSSWSLQYSKAKSLCGFQRSSNRTTIISILHLGLAQLSFYTFCGFCLSRILLYFPMSVRQLVRPSTGVTSPLYDVLDHTNHIFSESSWSKDIKTVITKCQIHKYK